MSIDRKKFAAHVAQQAEDVRYYRRSASRAADEADYCEREADTLTRQLDTLLASLQAAHPEDADWAAGVVAEARGGAS